MIRSTGFMAARGWRARCLRRHATRVELDSVPCSIVQMCQEDGIMMPSEMGADRTPVRLGSYNPRLNQGCDAGRKQGRADQKMRTNGLCGRVGIYEMCAP